MAIESKFLECLVDNLNAEIVLGTVTNEEEGVEWLRYTYLYQRLVSNPFAYGVDLNEIQVKYKIASLCNYQNQSLCTTRQATVQLFKATFFNIRFSNMIYS